MARFESNANRLAAGVCSCRASDCVSFEGQQDNCVLIESRFCRGVRLADQFEVFGITNAECFLVLSVFFFAWTSRKSAHRAALLIRRQFLERVPRYSGDHSETIGKALR